MTRTAEIAGAGLAGMAIAVRLAQHGWQVNLHEKSDDLRAFGAGIWLWENGLKSLEMMGIYDAATARAKIIKEWRICDEFGRTLVSRPSTDDRFMLPPRTDLYQALIDKANECGVQVHLCSTAVKAKPEGVLVLESGEERRADLVIAADGAYSRLRDLLMATSWVDYGIEAGIRTMIDYQPGDPEDLITEYINGSWRLLYNPCTDGENYIFLSAPIKSDAAKQVPVDKAMWKEKFPHAASLIDRLTEVGHWDQIVNVVTRHWSVGKVAILGDAAHAMPPNLGQAANMAFTNAMALAECVTDGASDIEKALLDWERDHRPLADHVQRWSYLYGHILGSWPAQFMGLRTDAIQYLAKSEWFEEGLNRGSRAIPFGYEKAMRLSSSQS